MCFHIGPVWYTGNRRSPLKKKQQKKQKKNNQKLENIPIFSPVITETTWFTEC